MNIRKEAVAGLFYEADPEKLRQHIAALMTGLPALSPAVSSTAQAKGLIVPHAGYVYSGRTAAAAYKLLEPLRGQIERVALFGPAHRVYLEGMAVPSAEAFATPLGEVKLDRVSIERLTSLPGVSVADEPHREEHSLEVQLPFLQTVLDEFSLVPVVVGRCPPGTVAAVMDMLWDLPNTLLVISTDLSHFHSYDDARRIDRLTCDRLLAKEHTLDGQEACGAAPLNGLMSTRRIQSLELELLDSCNSGDSAGGKERVVGYGSFLLH